jgi:hypothetical protein
MEYLMEDIIHHSSSNYAEHAKELGNAVPQVLTTIIINKKNNCKQKTNNFFGVLIIG